MRRQVAAFGVVLAFLSACSGVPSSSTPQVVSPIRVTSPAPVPTISPLAGDDARDIVTKFLTANLSSDPRHGAARTFLTPGAQSVWKDSTVTIVDAVNPPSALVGNVITVTENKVGVINADGVYTPDFNGDGDGQRGEPITLSFTMNFNKQWRIDKLSNGVIVGVSDFGVSYLAHNVYFLSADPNRVVVPDMRYTAITDPDILATWLVNELVAGPRPELASAVKNDLPDQSPSSRVGAVVTTGGVTVELPGTAQLDNDLRTGVAVQLSLTLATVALGADGARLKITDGGRPIPVPGHNAGVAANDFANYLPNATTGQLIFLRDGAALDETGTPLKGSFSGHQDLTSVALAVNDTSSPLVAAVSGNQGSERLLIGREDAGGLNDAGLSASTLTRPAWAPFNSPPAVWIGRGSTLLRIVVGSASAQSVTLNPAQPGQIMSVAFSADGARIALAIIPPGPPGQVHSRVWVGSVVVSGNKVRVEELNPISPPAIDVSDVTWSDATTLYVTGSDSSDRTPGIWDVRSDGSAWAMRTTLGLNGEAVSITAGQQAFPVVEAGGRIWQLRGSSWTPLYGTAVVRGTSPSYLQ